MDITTQDQDNPSDLLCRFLLELTKKREKRFSFLVGLLGTRMAFCPDIYEPLEATGIRLHNISFAKFICDLLQSTLCAPEVADDV